MEKIIVEGKTWRLKQGTNEDGTPRTGNCAWSACTGGAAHSHQWKFGSNREDVLSRIRGDNPYSASSSN